MNAQSEGHALLTMTSANTRVYTVKMNMSKSKKSTRMEMSQHSISKCSIATRQMARNGKNVQSTRRPLLVTPNSSLVVTVWCWTKLRCNSITTAPYTCPMLDSNIRLLMIDVSIFKLTTTKLRIQDVL